MTTAIADAEKLKLFENALQQIAGMTLWGEPIQDAELRAEVIDAGEYDEADDTYNPSCDSESTMLRDAVEAARAAITKASGTSPG